MFKKLLADAGYWTETPKPASAPIAPPLIPIVVTSPTTSGTTPPAALDERAVKLISDKVNQSTLPGYLDFVTMDAELQSDIPDSTVRARTAIKSVARMKGITPADILASVDDRITRLSAASQHLLENMANLLTSELASKDAQLSELDAKRKKLEEEIRAIQVKETDLKQARLNQQTELTSKQLQLKAAAASIGAQLASARNIIAANLN